MSSLPYQTPTAPATVASPVSAPGAQSPVIAGRPYDPALAARILAMLEAPIVDTLAALQPYDVASGDG